MNDNTEHNYITKKLVKRKILYTFLILCNVGMLFSIYKVVNWNISGEHTTKQLKEINQIIEVEERRPDNDNPNVVIVEPEPTIPEFNPYWDYINMPFISVDFNELLTKNNETVGWLKLNGTSINYPFVKAINNTYYLTRSFDKSYSIGGWIFMDYRNNPDTLDKNTIIYGHSLLDGTMFGTLKKAVTPEWLNNTNNHVVQVSTSNQNTLWQVFSVYITPNTSDYLYTKFDNDQQFVEFAESLETRSIHDFDVSMNADDKILTLSTCYQRVDRVVLHAKLIKIENR